MLRLDNVAMRYGDGPEVLRELNLELPRGDFVFLMGPTGAGKSSLLRLLGLLQMPCSGRFTLFERDVAALTREELSAFRRRIGIVFQDARLLDSKLARRLMHLFTQLRKLGTTVVLATHSDDLVDRYRHPILRIADGRLKGPLPPPATMAAAD